MSTPATTGETPLSWTDQEAPEPRRYLEIPAWTRSWRLWGILLVPLATFAVYQFSGSLGPHWADRGVNVGLDTLMAISAVLVLVRAWEIGKERLAWGFIGLAMVSDTIGDSLSTNLFNGSPSTPSICDPFWLAFVPLSAIGLAVLVTKRFPGAEKGRWIESGQAALIVASFGLILVFYPVLGKAHDVIKSQSGVIIALAYPIGDIILMGSILAAFALSGWKPGRAWLVLGAGYVLFALSDSIYSLQTIVGTYQGISPTQVGWSAAFLLVAHAAWMQPRLPQTVSGDDWRTVILPEIVSIVSLTVQVGAFIGAFPGKYQAARLMTITAQGLLLIKLVLGPSSFRRSKGMDDLTGLGNQYALMHDLGRCFRRPDNPHVLLLCEVEGISDYVRAHGRAAMAAKLRELADRLSAPFKQPARVYRVEQCDFYVLAPTHSWAQADALAVVGQAFGDEAFEDLKLVCSAIEVPEGFDSPDGALNSVERQLNVSIAASTR